MARLISSGFELNSTTANVEFDNVTGATVSTATVRSGVYAGRISSLSSGSHQKFRSQFKAANSNGPFYFRTYINVATLPSAENRILAVNNSATVTVGLAAYLTVDNTGAVRLYDEDGVVGSASPALSTSIWYRLELTIDRTLAAGSQIVAARIDGAEFARSTTSNLGAAGMSSFHVGGNLNSEAQTIGDWFFDDIAINDNTGSFQTSWPGAGHVIHLKPNAAGDSNTFAVQVGGTAGAGNNFTRTNEIPPDDATSYNGSLVLSQEDLFNVDNSGIGASDTVNVVSVGGRFADLVGADATAAFKFEIEKTGSGTKSQSAAIIPNSTTWKSNATATPLLYPIVLYQDPDSAAWTQTTLDSMQVGYVITAANVQTTAISNVWALVDYTAQSEVTTTSTSSSTSTSSTSTSTSSTSSSTSTSRSTSTSSTSVSTSSTSSSTSLSTSTSSTSSSVSTSSTSTSTSQSFTTSTSSTSTSLSTSTSFSTSSTSTSQSTSSTSSSTSLSTSQSTSTSYSTSSTVSTTTSTSSTSTSSTTTLPYDPRVVARIRQPILR